MNLQTSSLAPLLNPDTKEITKTESNKIQLIEMKRWNTSIKKQIYDTNAGMKYKKINFWPKIQLLKVQEGTVQELSHQVRLNKVFNTYQAEYQNIYNENTDDLIEHYKFDQCRQVEASFQHIIRSFFMYTNALEEQEKYTQNTLRGIVTVIEPNNSDDACGLTWLLLLTREACIPLTSWSELGSAERMMEALTRHSPVPEKMTVATTETLQIGSIIIK